MHIHTFVVVAVYVQLLSGVVYVQAEFNLLDVNCDGVIDREEFKSIRRRGPLEDQAAQLIPLEDLQAQLIKSELTQHVSNQTEEHIRDGLINLQQHGNGRVPSLAAASLSPPQHSSGLGPHDPRRSMRSQLTQHVSNQTQSDIVTYALQWAAECAAAWQCSIV